MSEPLIDLSIHPAAWSSVKSVLEQQFPHMQAVRTPMFDDPEANGSIETWSFTLREGYLGHYAELAPWAQQ